MKQSVYIHYGRMFFFVALAFVSLWILFPFFKTILTTLVLGIAFFPVYKKLLRRLHSKTLASVSTIGILILCLVIPFLFVVSGLISEISSSYSMFLGFGDSYTSGVSAVNGYLSDATGQHVDIAQPIWLLLRYFFDISKSFFASIPAMIINFFIMLFMLFFFFKESNAIRDFVIKLLPFSKEEKEHLMKKFSDVIYGVMFGHLITAIIQGAVAGVGYWIAGVPAPLLWTVVTIIMALIPFIGTAIVWAPASILMIVFGLDSGGWIWGVALFLYGFIFVSNIDNFVRPMLIAGKSHVHPAIVLLGALGGIAAFGLVGLFVGPLILALFKEFVIAFEEHRSL